MPIQLEGNTPDFLIPPSCNRHDHRLIKVAKVKIKKAGQKMKARRSFELYSTQGTYS